MYIKVPVSPKHKQWIEDQAARWKPDYDALKKEYEDKVAKEELRYKKYLEFWATNEKETYESNYPTHKDREISYEIEPVCKNSGKISVSSLEEMSFWACPFCNKEAGRKYIPTGHDHTDYSYDICDCEGAKNGGGKHYDKLN